MYKYANTKLRGYSGPCGFFKLFFEQAILEQSQSHALVEVAPNFPDNRGSTLGVPNWSRTAERRIEIASANNKSKDQTREGDVLRAENDGG
jgi:hypothetical protein